MQPTHPIRLGLALNFSVFYYEIMGDAKQACTIAKEALESAIEVIDDCSEENFQEAQSIIELLRENLNIWCEEVEMDNML